MSWDTKVILELETLLRDYPNETYQQYADRLNSKFGTAFTSEAVRKRLFRAKKSNGISFADQKNAEVHDPRELIRIVNQLQEEVQKRDDRQTSITVNIDGDKPIGIAFTGDWHVGGLYTDHVQMEKDFELIRDTEGLYNVVMGDYADNYITRSHAGGSFEQVITADKQKVMCEYYFDILAANNLAVIKGNHDYWSSKETGEDWVAYIARKIDRPYLWYGGEINLRLGDQVYKIHAHHTYQYNSSINTTNSQRNLFNATHADVIALGHLHWNEVHAKRAGGKETVWMRTGSYKRTDDYTQYLGGFRGDERVPMVILYPDRKKVLGFQSIYDGVKMLKVERGD
jgi:predicted phosphodiesterase